MARQIAERRSGRDPSEQEPEGRVRQELGALRADLRAHVVRLRLRAVLAAPEPEVAALAQAFEDRVLLDDTARTLAVVHQKLLSLYPAVDEGLIEDVRLAASEAARQITDGVLDRGLSSFTARLADLADALAEL